MAYQKCLDCGKVISDGMPACPYCGKPMADQRSGGDRRRGRDRRSVQSGHPGGNRRRGTDRRRGSQRRKLAY